MLRSLKLFHGKRGAGLSVEFKVRYGPVTIVGCTQTADGRAEAHRRPRASRSRARRSGSATRTRACASRSPPAEFFEPGAREGPTHHVALGVGHVAGEVRSVARLLGLEYARGGLRWSASASCCTSGPSGSTSTGRATARSGRRCSTRCARPAGATTRCSCAPDGLLVGYLETEDFEAAQRGDGGHRRQRALAGARWRRSSTPAASGGHGFERLEEVFHLA